MTGFPLFRMLAVVGRGFYRECTELWFDQPFNCINSQTSTYCLCSEPRFDQPFNSINILLSVHRTMVQSQVIVPCTQNSWKFKLMCLSIELFLLRC